MPLVTTKEMFERAYREGYAVGAFNVNNMEMIQAIVEAANECRSPVILQVSAGARKYANPVYLMHLVKAAAETTDIPIALHLDHGADFEICKASIDSGFTSVMIDASSKPWEENIAITRQVVEYAHAHGCVVEAELGTLAGIEDDVSVEAADAQFTSPDEVEEFTTKTGIDSLAIAIGTSHGAYKFKPGQDPKLRLDILEEIGRRLPNFPIVLHGASSVPQDKVAMVNQFGGHMPDAIGIPESELLKAAKMAVCKINIDSDLRVAFTAAIRKHFAEHPDHFDPRQYLGDARAMMKEMVKHKIINVLGSANKAQYCPAGTVSFTNNKFKNTATIICGTGVACLVVRIIYFDNKFNLPLQNFLWRYFFCARLLFLKASLREGGGLRSKTEGAYDNAWYCLIIASYLAPSVN